MLMLNGLLTKDFLDWRARKGEELRKDKSNTNSRLVAVYWQLTYYHSQGSPSEAQLKGLHDFAAM
jgi:hypothetical protein